MFSSYTHLLILFSLSLLIFISQAQAQAQAQALTNQKALNNSNSSISALFVFGDSTVDPGNNNYITTAFKSNFPPYGRDLANHMPTGRFCNGRLSTDFIASYLGLKEYVPPYLDPTLSIEELMTGVSFASAGSGYDPLTPRISGVIQLSKQQEYFKEYKTRLELAIGKQRTENHIKNGVFIVSAGTNDFVVNYFGVKARQKSYTVSTYQKFLLQHVQQFIQGLWDLGARKIVAVGLPPMGCLPIVITLNSDNAFLPRDCIESLSSISRDYNQMLHNQLKAIHNSLVNHGGRIAYFDLYGSVINMIQDPKKYGFDVVNCGCCGTGLIEASLLCNPKSFVCSDASKYVFWDAIHPSEKGHYIVFKDTRPVIDFLIKD